MRRVPFRLVLASAAAALALATPAAPPPAPVHAQLVIVVDGLRPDYIGPDVMPRLSAIGRRGIVFNAHHAVFPTVTRVNASSLVTGVYPETHGLLGNTVYVPSVNPLHGLDTGSRDNLEAIARADPPLLDAPTLGEILPRAGRSLFVAGSGTAGAVFLLNHTLNGGIVIHNDYVRPPDAAAHVVDRIGPTPPHATPNAGQNRRAVDAYLTLALEERHPDLAFLWLSDPDTTAHAKGVATAPTRQALTLVDGEIGRIEDALRAKDQLDRTNIIVVSDHGFSTHTGALKLAALVAPFARPLPGGSPDIVVAEGAIYLRGDRARLDTIVAALQRRPEVGAIFTRPGAQGGLEGVVPGTLSFDVAHANHRRAGDVLVSANWSADANDAGFAGTTTDSGVAGHGTSGPYDIHNTLIAVGPDFREHTASNAPTGNVDIAPTLLRLLRIDPPRTMTGRAIEEAFRGGPDPASLSVRHDGTTVKSSDGSYVLTAHTSTVLGHRYLDYTNVDRR
jgi:arylsulfatase A-like enzyme